MHVLVTGGAGFIGSHLVEALLAGGHQVSVLDNLSTGKRDNVPPEARLFEADLRDREQTFAVLREARPTHISHQAAQASVAVSVQDPGLDAQVNLLGGIHLVEACLQPGLDLEHLVFASTGGAIYGDVPEGILAREDTPPVPLSPYAIHKLAFEQLLGVYRTHRALRCSTLRYSNVYGPRQDPFGEAGVVAMFFHAVLNGKPIRINARKQPGDDGCVRDYVYVDDVVRANLKALAGEVSEKVLNVCSGTATTTRELGDRIQSIASKTVPVESGPPRPGDVERSVLDPSRARPLLGEPTLLEVGLSHTHAFYARLQR